MDDFALLDQIGKGACGAVYQVRQVHTKKLFALKKIQLDESRKTRTKEAVLREARILSELKHPYIVLYQDSFFDENEEYLCIIQDFCDGGTMEDLIKEAAKKQNYFPEETVVQWFLQVALGVRYMHSQKVLHRDLKASNVFLNKSASVCKIGDFGIAKSMDTMEVARTCVGTPCYLSPEMCQDIPYSSKADIWALGCMLYEMLALTPAFDANNLVSLFYKIVKGEYDPLPPCYSQDMVNVVMSILIKSPEDRPSARGVLAIPYLKRELLLLLEEKELQQQRLPTRQGSRPYSTPNLIRFVNGQVKTLPDSMSDSSKRAMSCRPNIIIDQTEGTSIAHAKPSSRAKKVATIMEEVEENEKTSERPSSTSSRTKMTKPSDTDSPSQQRRTKQDDYDEKDIYSKASKHNVDLYENQRNRVDGSLDLKDFPSNHESSSEGQGHSQEHWKSQNTSFARMDLSIPCAKEGDPNTNHVVLNSDSTSKKVNLDFHDFDRDLPKRNKIQEPTRTPRIQESNALIIQTPTIEEDETELYPKKSPPLLVPPAAPAPQKSKPSPTKQTPKTTSSSTSTTPDKQRTSNKAKKKSPVKPKKPESARRSRALEKGKSGHPKPLLKQDSRRSLPSEPAGYYSDDFDDTGSDIQEEIPEEIPSLKLNFKKNQSLTQTFEIPEIEEDLPGGLEADDDGDYASDFEEEIEEDLDEVVSAVRKARDELESVEVPDEVILDDRRPNTSKVLRRHCLNILGREKYDKVNKLIENNDESEYKKIEKAIGKEHSKTIHLMAEISRKKSLGHS